MTFRGTVRNGVVVLESPNVLRDGSPVLVQPVREPAWLRHAGTISQDDALRLLRAIDETCERVDPESSP